MNSKSVGIIAAVCAVVGVSAAFLLLGGVNSSQILDNNQEVSQISISSTFSERRNSLNMLKSVIYPLINNIYLQLLTNYHF